MNDRMLIEGCHLIPIRSHAKPFDGYSLLFGAVATKKQETIYLLDALDFLLFRLSRFVHKRK